MAKKKTTTASPAKKKPAPVTPPPSAVEMAEQVLHIGDLVPDPKNARRHNPRNVGAIVNSLHTVGAGRSIVIDENDVILAGNATIEAAGQAGIERVRVVEVDGNEIVAVKRRGLTPKQKAQLAISDNRAGELAEWEGGVLNDLIVEHEIAPETVEFTEDELEKIVVAAGVRSDAEAFAAMAGAEGTSSEAGDESKGGRDKGGTGEGEASDARFLTLLITGKRADVELIRERANEVKDREGYETIAEALVYLINQHGN